MKKTLWLLIIFAAFATTVYAGVFEGPLVIKNGHPLYAAVGSPSLVSAELENSLTFDFSYSSTYLVDRSKDWSFGLDLETAITDIQIKQVVGAETEIGLDIPVIRYGPGFMDNALNTYHRVIGMANAYGRLDRPRNQFLLEVTRDGKTVILGEAGKTALGDVMVEVKKVYYNTSSATVGVQAFLNVPTGDPDSAFGSGRTNGGIAVLVNEKCLNDVMLYLNTGIGLIDRLQAMQEVKLKNYYYGGLGLEWIYSKAILLNAQMTIQGSPFPKTGVASIDDPAMMASVGGRYKLSALSTFGITVTEDPDIAGAPDIMMSVDYRYRF